MLILDIPAALVKLYHNHLYYKPPHILSILTWHQEHIIQILNTKCAYRRALITFKCGKVWWYRWLRWVETLLGTVFALIYQDWNPFEVTSPGLILLGDHPFKTSACLGGEGRPHVLMVKRSQYIRIKNPLHKHFAGMPMVVGVKNRENLPSLKWMVP